MSFSYDPSAAASSGLSWVRMRVADTSSSSNRLEDEEIEALLDQYGNKWLAAAAAAEQIGATYSLRTDKTIGKLSIKQGDIAQRYHDLADRLRFESKLQAKPFAGGISRSQKDSETQDSDRDATQFEVEQFDNVSQLVDPSTALY